MAPLSVFRLLILVVALSLTGILIYQTNSLGHVFSVPTLWKGASRKQQQQQERIILYTGIASTWHTLSNLSDYFTPAEQAGILTKTCGDINDPTNPWQWQGSLDASRRGPSFESGPCCPNGHTYGWFGRPLNDTEPLRKVEVTSTGHMVQPFQIRELVNTLDKVCRNKTKHADDDDSNIKDAHNSNSTIRSIWIMGDSTSNQVFFAFLCALIRIGGVVETCLNLSPSHYEHPVCNHTTKAIRNLDWLSTDNVNHQYFVIHLPSGHRYHVHHFIDKEFCYNHLQSDHYCKAHDMRFLKLAKKLPEPDLFLVNIGLHMRTKKRLRTSMKDMFDLLSSLSEELSSPLLLSKVIWHETTLSHFPDISHTGQFETWQNNFNRGWTTSIACADIVLDDNVNKTTTDSIFWRQEVARTWLTDTYFKRTGIDVPILSMNETEMHLYETYPLPREGSKRADCVHRIYTPLYWDSFFWRLSQLIQFKQQEWERTPATTNDND